MKYLRELFVPYTTSLEINILSTSVSLALNGFLSLQKIFLLIFLSSINYTWTIHSYIIPFLILK